MSKILIVKYRQNLLMEKNPLKLLIYKNFGYNKFNHFLNNFLDKDIHFNFLET